MNKNDLLQRLEESRENFLALIDPLQDEQLIEPGVMETWSVKDILAHLTMWEAQLITLLFKVKQGKKPQTVHFQGDSVDAINQKWLEQHKGRDLHLVLSDFNGIRNQTILRVEMFSEADLVRSDRFPWAKGKPLWKWVAADTFEHEAEHAQHIQAWLGKQGSHG
jgi:hypothetical protein